MLYVGSKPISLYILILSIYYLLNLESNNSNYKKLKENIVIFVILLYELMYQYIIY